MVNPPKPDTLKKYGLSLDQWRMILQRQNGVCAICQKEPSTGRLCIDHEHVKGWKKKESHERRLFVRGLLCFFCNHYYVARGISIAKAQAVVAYLTEYEKRKGTL